MADPGRDAACPTGPFDSPADCAVCRGDINKCPGGPHETTDSGSIRMFESGIAHMRDGQQAKGERLLRAALDSLLDEREADLFELARKFTLAEEDRRIVKRERDEARAQVETLREALSHEENEAQRLRLELEWVAYCDQERAGSTPTRAAIMAHARNALASVSPPEEGAAVSDSESMYQMLRDRDAEIRGLRDVIADLQDEFAQMYAEDEQEEAYARAGDVLSKVYYRHGFKSDGRFRG